MRPPANRQASPPSNCGHWRASAPANPPKHIVNRLRAEVKAAIAKPDVTRKLRLLGTDPEYLPGRKFDALATKDFETWDKVMRDNNIKLD